MEDKIKETKEKFLKNFSMNDIKLNPLIDLVIDETIENILNGNTKIDDKIPETDEEIFSAICYGFMHRKKILDYLTSIVELNDNVKITYKNVKL